MVTEFGSVNLFGKSTQERALALISLAHPDFRDQLFEQGKELGMIGRERRLGESVRGIYPVRIEETLARETSCRVSSTKRPVLRAAICKP